MDEPNGTRTAPVALGMLTSLPYNGTGFRASAADGEGRRVKPRKPMKARRAPMKPKYGLESELKTFDHNDLEEI